MMPKLPPPWLVPQGRQAAQGPVQYRTVLYSTIMQVLPVLSYSLIIHNYRTKKRHSQADVHITV